MESALCLLCFCSVCVVSSSIRSVITELLVTFPTLKCFNSLQLGFLPSCAGSKVHFPKLICEFEILSEPSELAQTASVVFQAAMEAQPLVLTRLQMQHSAILSATWKYVLVWSYKLGATSPATLEPKAEPSLCEGQLIFNETGSLFVSTGRGTRSQWSQPAQVLNTWNMF